MDVKHISNIKYKGFHPLDKKKTINKINSFIDLFNRVNDELYQKQIMTWSSFCKTLENDISSSWLEAHRNYLVKYIGYASSQAMKLVNKSSKQREKNFKKSLESITTDPQLRLTKINSLLTEDYFFGMNGLKNYIISEENRLSDKFEELKLLTFLKMKSFLKTQQIKKLNELDNGCKEWIKTIKDKYYDAESLFKPKAIEIVKALMELQKICKNKSGKLSENAFSCLKRMINNNRNAVKLLEHHSPIKHSPVKTSNEETNRIVLSFMGMITDSGTDISKLIINYIEEK